MTEPINASNYGYAVLLKRSDGTTMYALSDSGMPAVFFRRKRAVTFRDERIRNRLGKGRVVKVHCELRDAP